MTNLAFKSYNQGQIQLFPSRLDERIADNSPVRLINSIIDGLDLSSLFSTYEGGGTTAYHPRMLLKVVFYAYMNNVYSCRKIARLLEENIHYMWLSGSQYPSFNTINRFRSEHLKDSINNLFTQVVLMLVDLGQVSLDVSYIDGTKIESVANKYTFVWKKSVEKNREKLQGKIRSILNQIDQGIAQDNNLTEDSPLEIDSSLLRARIDELNRCGKHQDKEGKKQLKELDKHHDKLREYEQKLDILGNRNSYSKTDEDATFMRMKEDAMNNGQTKPGYNVQIGTENQYVTNYGLYHTPGDTTTLNSFLTLQGARLGRLPKVICADAGYGSEENYQWMENNHIEAFVKYNYFHKEQKKAYKNNPFLQDNLYYNVVDDYFVCPMGQHMTLYGKKKSFSENGFISHISLYKAKNCKGCPMHAQCHKTETERIIQVNHNLREHKRKVRERLTSDQGLQHRSRRPIEPEAVFGQIKYNKGYKRFRHKGLDKVNMDLGILLIAFNIQKLWRRTRKKELLEGKTRKNTTIYVLKLIFIVCTANKKQTKERYTVNMAA